VSVSPASYDVVISGGGLVGASLACALAGLPLRVALVERVPPGSDAQPSFDERTIALSRGSQRILAGIGAWAGVGSGACPIRTIHVSERGRFGSAVISAEEQGIGDLGYVVASRTLGAALWEKIRSTPNVEVFCPGSLAEPRIDDEAVELKREAAATRGALRARLLAIADGARSDLRGALGIGTTERSYGQTAIVGNVELANSPPAGTAYERFTAGGPVALLPFLDDRYVFVMARRTTEAEAAMRLDDAQFLELLQASLGRRLGRFRRLGKRSAYPLSLVEADRITVPRTTVIGNAAHGLHPVAGQGYNLGLRDVATLAEVIADAVRAGEDPGAAAALKRYADWRRRDQRNVIRFTDGLIRLFDLSLPPAGAARGLGLLLFDVVPGAKRALARRTMGLSGELTRLARGLPL
jgi:2-octaprenyl-6-methoxyphenol hydroxylase